MNMDILLIIKMLALTWFITSFQPFQNILSKINPKNDWLNLITRCLKEPLTCWKCAGFWITLIITQSFWLAIITSMIASLVDNNLNRIKLN